MKYILYTTSKSSRIKELADIFASEISKTKGRGIVTVDVVYKMPKKVPVSADSDGDIRFSWDWFSETFLKKDYDGVLFHFTPALRKKWKMSTHINGSQNHHNREFVQFWLCCDTATMSKGYKDLPEFLRIMYHEQAHYDESLDDTTSNILAPASVHTTDYRLKQIHLYHYLVDYRGQALRNTVNTVVDKVIKLVKKYI